MNSKQHANRPASRWTVTVVALAILVLGATTLAATYGGEGGPQDSDMSFVSGRGTDALLDEMATLTTQIFTIRPGQVEATRKKVSAGLVGNAVETYARLYGPYLDLAAKEGVALVTTVRAIGVTTLSGDEAELLLFADQTATAKGRPAAVGSAQVALGVERSAGRWRISSIEVM